MAECTQQLNPGEGFLLLSCSVWGWINWAPAELFSDLVPLIFQFQCDLLSHNQSETINRKLVFFSVDIAVCSCAVMQMSSNTSCCDLFAAWYKRKKKNSHSSQKSWCDSRATLANHNHSLSVYQTTHGRLWLLNKKKLQNHSYQFEFETCHISGEKSCTSFPFSSCRWRCKWGFQEASTWHMCVFDSGGRDGRSLMKAWATRRQS